MKKYIILLMAALTIVSCNSEKKAEQMKAAEKEHQMQMISDYLLENYPKSVFHVLDIEKELELYTPYDIIMSVRLRLAGKTYKDEVDENMFDDVVGIMSSVEKPIAYTNNHPDKEKRKCLQAVISANGEEGRVLFFMNRDGDTISHDEYYLQECSDEIYNRFVKLLPR